MFSYPYHHSFQHETTAGNVVIGHTNNNNSGVNGPTGDVAPPSPGHAIVINQADDLNSSGYGASFEQGLSNAHMKLRSEGRPCGSLQVRSWPA